MSSPTTTSLPTIDARQASGTARTFADLLKLLDETPAWTPPAGAEPDQTPTEDAEEKPQIWVTPNESHVIDEAITLLATRQNLYQRGGNLVQVVTGTAAPPEIARPSDAPHIGLVKFARIQEHLADAADWFNPDAQAEENRKIHPPAWVVKGIDARGQWSGVPRIEAVVQSPILRANGSILQAAGYDSATGIFYQPEVEFPPVPESPTRDDALLARDALLEVVRDFPYASEAHRAGWLAATLTPLRATPLPDLHRSSCLMRTFAAQVRAYRPIRRSLLRPAGRPHG